MKDDVIKCIGNRKMLITEKPLNVKTLGLVREEVATSIVAVCLSINQTKSYTLLTVTRTFVQ